MKKEITIIIPAGEKTEIKALGTIDKKSINVIIERGKNPSQNRNRGALKAKTDYIAFINSHTLLDKNWQKQVLRFFKQYPEIDIVGGPQLTHPSEGFFAKVSGYALSSIFGSAKASNRYKKTKLNLKADEYLITSANLICKRTVFEKIKFNEKLYPGEDPKFIDDAIKAGFKVAYSPDIIVYNLRRQSLGLLFKQVFSYGAVRPQKESLFQTLKKPYFLAPSLLVIYLILLPILISIKSLMILPLYAYFLLDLLFSLYESIKNKSISSLALLMFIFPVIHLGYGLGFLYGLIKKIWRRKNH